MHNDKLVRIHTINSYYKVTSESQLEFKQLPGHRARDIMQYVVEVPFLYAVW